MNKKGTIILHVGFWIYLLFGGGVFYWIEDSVHNFPPKNRSSLTLDFCSDFITQVQANLINDKNFSLPRPNYLDILWSSCVRNLTIYQNKSISLAADGIIWDFSAALFLTTTILTTVGYGNVVPVTMAGKIFCILYGFVGIPLGGLMLASTSNQFSNHLLRLYERKRRKYNEKRGIFLAAIVYLIPGLIVFLFTPAAIFTALEDWSYLDAFYFSFITLTTIGFGEIVAAQHSDSSWLWFYRVSLIVWIVIGIGYWAMIIAFVTKAFKSKELRRRWDKTSVAIAHHAVEMRKAVEQLSSNSRTEDFLALRSKTSFEFILQLTALLGHLGLERNRRMSLPGIATAFKPHHSNNRGIVSLIELSLMVMGKDKKQQQEQEDQSADLEDNDGAVNDNNVGPNAVISHSQSQDSGFGEDNNKVHFKLNLAKTESSHSLPTAPVTVTAAETRKKSLGRSPTQPELLDKQKNLILPTDRQALAKLLVEAMFILHEAAADGSVLDLSSD